MRRTLLAGATALMATAALGSASAQTITYTVDCSKGQTITSAIQRGDARKPLLVVVRGTCKEHVSISRDDVTLRGQPGTGATVSGPNSATDTILILKDMVNIEDLTVTGGNNGIRLQGPSYAGVKNVSVRNTANNGILVRAGDIAIDNSTVEYAGGSGLVLGRGASARIFNNSQFRDSHFAGIYAASNSTVSFNGGAVSDNEGHGITVESGSQANVSNVEIFGNSTGIMVSASQANVGGGNSIHHNRGPGVNAQMGAVVAVDENSITGNEGDGVTGYLGSTLVLHGNVISSNKLSGVGCAGKCLVQIGGATIENNEDNGITLVWGATLILEEPATIVGGNQTGFALWCGDSESSVNDASLLNTSQRVECTDFNN